MEVIVVFISSVVSGFLFDFSKITPTTVQLVGSYKQIPIILNNNNLNDDEKQREMIKTSVTQVKYLIVLTLKLILIISPFISILLFDINPLTLVSLKMVLISVLGVLVYVGLKKVYERTFNHR